MSNQFCRYLSNGYSFFIKHSSVAVQPCCWYTSSIPLTPNLLQHRKLESDSIAGWTKNCKHCKVLEDAGQSSLRHSSKDWIDDGTSLDPVTIDINLDYECNAACVTCGDTCSSLWAKENAKLKNTVIPIQKNNLLVDQAIDQIVNTVSLEHLKYVKFFGGEPLFTDTHLKFLQHIPHPTNVTLHYTTNGSIYPNQQTLKVWKQFKTVIFAASLDGVNEQFNYVRWPLPWHKVSENLLRLKNDNISNIMFRVEFTANFLNTYYFDQLEEWITENLVSNLSGDLTEVTIHPCWGDTWNLTLMPDAIRRIIMEKYPKDHRVHMLVKNLPPPTSLHAWEKFVEIWDKRRKNSWQHAFPDLIQYI